MMKKPHKDTEYLRPEQRFFGRRKGPTLSNRQTDLINGLLPKITIEAQKQKTPHTPLNTRALFDECDDIWLEIGFGKGEHIAWQAENNPSVGLIGCEPYMNGVASLLDKVEANNLMNVRVYSDDARHILWHLPDASVSKVFLIHPDPWPKKRHARRRFVNPDNLDDISRILKPGGEFRIGTDHPIYREWTMIQMANRNDFIWTAENPVDWQKRPDDWPETRYEVKAMEGKATYFIFKKC
ncbi:tRNA (guanosine(46)-N7)-methyltransferase TrmB [Kordiimonas sp. SCSIO 12610]|uniref:tRNA (guanosine(46)-N7)-methyltransferase TrmB n=1 Tax=Kordiimonas sp. SCSIO 12610 TaxID=2829597 RepID=UPI00210EFFC6|nr:tRNA (guanosine(46)-N7)-methyltransferase TrmB [Kordiimonas sp. SCSIO 12610]UTW55097.1 tRNA (guanosine(46)-N7)-methyltransferase TrmB [Kordiimonas sp. SCSIO 12610]